MAGRNFMSVVGSYMTHVGRVVVAPLLYKATERRRWRSPCISSTLPAAAALPPRYGCLEPRSPPLTEPGGPACSQGAHDPTPRPPQDTITRVHGEDQGGTYCELYDKLQSIRTVINFEMLTPFFIMRDIFGLSEG